VDSWGTKAHTGDGGWEGPRWWGRGVGGVGGQAVSGWVAPNRQRGSRSAADGPPVRRGNWSACGCVPKPGLTPCKTG
jgi:hypothetical protein